MAMTQTSSDTAGGLSFDSQCHRGNAVYRKVWGGFRERREGSGGGAMVGSAGSPQKLKD